MELKVNGRSVLIDDADWLGIAELLATGHRLNIAKAHYGDSDAYCYCTIWKRSRYIATLGRWLLGAIRGVYVDYRNENRLDCRRENLRLVTATERSAKGGSARTRPFRGVVSYQTQRHGPRHNAQIQRNGRRIFIGTYAKAEPAARAYDRVARKLFGERARLNFPTP